MTSNWPYFALNKNNGSCGCGFRVTGTCPHWTGGPCPPSRPPGLYGGCFQGPRPLQAAPPSVCAHGRGASASTLLRFLRAQSLWAHVCLQLRTRPPDAFCLLSTSAGSTGPAPLSLTPQLWSPWFRLLGNSPCSPRAAPTTSDPCPGVAPRARLVRRPSRPVPRAPVSGGANGAHRKRLASDRRLVRFPVDKQT